MLRSIFSSIYFNFHYLPFKQAIRLPILLYKPKFGSLKGNVLINSQLMEEGIRWGMIRLGVNYVSIYPNSGIMFDCQGGSVIFNGPCTIGNQSAISVGKQGYLSFGYNFRATTSLKLVCYNKTTFKDNVLVGWDVLIMDTDFHRLTKVSGGYTRGLGEIEIGCNNWIANGCKIMKNSKTPDYSVISASTLINSDLSSYPEYSIFENRNEYIVRTGYWRNPDDDQIEYPSNVNINK